jgi:hypothetical protein
VSDATVLLLDGASEEEARARLAETLAAPSLRSVRVVPSGAAPGEPIAPPPGVEDFVAFHHPPTALAKQCYVEEPARVLSWSCSRGVLQDLAALAPPSSWNCASPIRAVIASGRPVAWLSCPLAEPKSATAPDPPISRASRVLAILPFWARDEWLALAIGSLAMQTHRPDAIVVVDDASPVSPRAIVERFPGVTLLRSPTRVGPYRLAQQVIDDTRFDAYLFQDSDDFSAVDRLERLLAEGERTGAELIGTQALWLDWGSGACGLASAPTTVPPPSLQSVYSILHPSSLVSRALVERLGGYASGLQFSGDLELQLRAMLVTTLVNTSACSYFKLRHADSLTGDPETGIHSKARVELRASVRARLAENLARVAAGAAPDLTPFRTAPPVALRRVCGPSLAASWG